jgi:hypothetical protein
VVSQVLPTCLQNPVVEFMGKGLDLCLCMLEQGSRLILARLDDW